MNPEYWQRIKAVYQQALDRNDSERDAFVREACKGDEQLAQDVLELLGVPMRDSGSLDDVVEAASASFDQAAASGGRIGPWRLLSVLGRGGMGHVYLAERADDEFEQRVAIKMANWLGASPELIERFRLERQILASLEHPNIARLFDGGQTAAGVPYLVMEYVDGRSILDYGNSNALSLRARLELFLKICDAVQYAHSKLVIHRDLKPSNVLVTDDGTPKLLDFGIAKLLDSAGSEALTRADVRVLTPEYASPEQMLGAPITTATDVYGLGMMLYQLLAGTLPFDLSSKTSPQIHELVCHTEPALPSDAAIGAGQESRAARLRGDLDNIVMLALRKDPERRYATVKDFADDVRNYLARKPVHARGDSWSYRTSKFLRRHSAAATATAVVFVAVAALTGFYTLRLASERDKALEERHVAESTTDFLVELFNVSDPGKSSGATITAREVLDQGALRIRNELKDDDAVRSRMLQTIGRVYERLGLYDDALALMQEAVTLNRRILPDDDRRLVDSLDELAWLYYRKENWQDAFDTASEALVMQRKPLGHDDVSMVRTLNHLGTIVYYLDDYAGSLAYYQRALATLSTPKWANNELRATTLNHLGIVYATLSRFPEAEQAYQESLAIRRRVLGENHPDTATAYANLGAFYSNIGKYDKAREFALKALTIDRATKGDKHVDVAYSLNLLGDIATQAGDPETALPYVLEAADIWRVSAGPTHSRYARALDLLCDTYRKLNRYPEAEAAGLQSLKILNDHYGPEHSLTADPHYTLGKLYLDMGDTQRAKQHLDQALNIRVHAFGENNVQVWNVMHILAKVEIATGDVDSARKQIAHAKALIEAAGQTDAPIYSWLQELEQKIAS